MIHTLQSPYTTLQDVIDGLGGIERGLRKNGDRRAVFTTAYLNMTLEIAGRVGESSFFDPTWVGRYAVAFANLYRTALLSYESGDLERTPKPWRQSFDASKNGRALLIQDLLLGVNAHINHDLALALVEATIDPDRPKRRADHTAVNESIRRATDPVQEAVTSYYAPALKRFDRFFGRIDEELTSFSIDKARLAAWISAVSLTNARDETERTEVRGSIEDRASVMARLILRPTMPSRVIGAIQRLEARTHWTDLIPSPH